LSGHERGLSPGKLWRNSIPGEEGGARTLAEREAGCFI